MTGSGADRLRLIASHVATGAAQQPQQQPAPVPTAAAGAALPAAAGLVVDLTGRLGKATSIPPSFVVIFTQIWTDGM